MYGDVVDGISMALRCLQATRLHLYSQDIVRKLSSNISVSTSQHGHVPDSLGCQLTFQQSVHIITSAQKANAVMLKMVTYAPLNSFEDILGHELCIWL